MEYRKYIGSRYVPIFGRKNEQSIQWDNTGTYEPLTIVLHQGNSYTSRQFVPAGIDINNEEFWALTGNYNGQVEQYRNEVLNYREDVIQYAEDVTECKEQIVELGNTVSECKEQVDECEEQIGELGNTISEFNNKAIVPLIAISKNRAYDNKNSSDFWIYGSYDGLNFNKIQKLPGMTGYSTFLAKIGKYYYFCNGKGYQYSEDLINWSNRYEFEIPEVTAIDDNFWAGSILNDTNSNRLYFFCSYQYDNTPFINNIGISTPQNQRVVYFEIEQADNGSLNKIGTVEYMTNSSDSYIDPVCIYDENVGYILAMKNEKKSNVEIWTGADLTNLSKNDILAPLYGIEAPQLVKTDGGVILYVDGWDPHLLDYETYGDSCKLDFNRVPADSFATCIVRKETLETYCTWQPVNFGATVSHPGFLALNFDDNIGFNNKNMAFICPYNQRLNVNKHIFNSELSTSAENYLMLSDYPYMTHNIGGIAADKQVTVIYKNIFNNGNKPILITFLGRWQLAARLKCGVGIWDSTGDATTGYEIVKPDMTPTTGYGFSYTGVIIHRDPTIPDGKRLVLPVKQYTI